MPVQDALESIPVDSRFADHPPAEKALAGRAAGLGVQDQGVLGKIADHEIKDLIQQVEVDFILPGLFDDQLAVNHQGE